MYWVTKTTLQHLINTLDFNFLCLPLTKSQYFKSLLSISRLIFVQSVMSNCCCKYKLLEISRLLSHADLRTIELSRTFHQVMQLLRNTGIKSVVGSSLPRISTVLPLGVAPY